MKLSLLFLIVAASAIVLCAADSDESRAEWEPESIEDSGLREYHRNHRGTGGKPRPPPPRPPTSAAQIKLLARILKTLVSIDRRLAGSIPPPRPSPSTTEPSSTDASSSAAPESSSAPESTEVPDISTSA